EKFIISNHKNVSDNLMVLLLLYVTKNQRNPINIVTLSESYEDLESIFEVQKKLLSIKVYQQHLALCKKIIAMIAKSDTVRVSSIAVDYYQDRASGQLLMLKKIAKDNYNLDLKLHIFSGGGDALQRGGGRHDELAYRVA
ncbi:MAG: phosphoenolpyruvate carboxylase, partial [Alphaproteobacteria bacterium]